MKSRVCPASGKLGYRKQSQAESHARGVKRRHRGARLTSYVCPDCGMWHVAHGHRPTGRSS